MSEYLVNLLEDTLNDGTLRSAIQYANSNPQVIVTINVTVSGTISLTSSLPKITTSVILNGNGIMLSGNHFQTIKFCNSNNSSLDNFIIYGSSNGIIIYKSNNVSINNCEIYNNGCGINIIKSTSIVIGNNLNADENYYSNYIYNNQSMGINIYKSLNNTVVNNVVGLDSTQSASPNGENGINIIKGGGHTIGGNIYTNSNNDENNPTGSENTIPPVFVRPLLGNLISCNGKNGIKMCQSINNYIMGNFVGTDHRGVAPLGNKNNGIYILKCSHTQIVGCSVPTNPFVYYNVLSGNEKAGLMVTDSKCTLIQGNFMGIGADNLTAVPNQYGLVVNGNSNHTVVGGIIPLGNVISGNNSYGVWLTDNISDFVSFNTFCGLRAFGTVLGNEVGFMIDHKANHITLRTNVISGNRTNGLHIIGHVYKMEITSNIIGLNTNGIGPIPNEHSGIYIGENAKNISFGIDISSVIPLNSISGNLKYGVHIGGQATDITMYNTNIGLAANVTTQFSNGMGGLYIDEQAHNMVIGNYNALNYICDLTRAVVLGHNTCGIKLTTNFININVQLSAVTHTTNIDNLSKNNFVFNNNLP